MSGHLCMEPPCTAVPFSKPNELAATNAKHMINNARGMPLPIQMHVKGGSDFQYLFTHGGQPCMDGQLSMIFRCMAVRPIETH